MILTTSSQLSPQQELIARVSSILKKAYGSVLQIKEIKSDKYQQIVWGKFSGMGGKVCGFTINLVKNRVDYKLLEEPRHDAENKIYFGRKAFKCVRGVPCKGICIAKGKVCRSEINNPQELKRMQSLIQRVPSSDYDDQREESADVVDRSEQKKGKYNDLTIRELKRIASEKGLTNYSSLNSSQLIEGLEALDNTDPETKEVLYKTFSRRKKEKQALIQAAGLIEPGFGRAYKKFTKFFKILGENPELFTPLLLVGAVAGTKGVYDIAQSRYVERIPEHALTATKIAEKIDIEQVDKPNITFVVGNNGSKNEALKVKELLEPADDTKEERWFKEDNHTIAVGKNLGSENDPTAEDGTNTPTGIGKQFEHTVAYAKQVAGSGIANASIDLAAHLYTYGNEYPDKKLNIVGHGNSGVYEAVDILSRMKPPEGSKTLSGKEIAEKLNIVSLGTSNLGFTDGDKMWKTINNRTITSTEDPFFLFPKKNGIYINQVKGYSPESYLKTPEVREEMRSAFDYYADTNLSNKRERERSLKDNRASKGSDRTGVFSSDKVRASFENAVGLGNNREAGSIIGADFADIPLQEYEERQKKLNREIERAANDALKRSNQLDRTIKEDNKPPYKNALIMVGGTLQSSDDMISSLPEDLIQGRAIVNIENYNIRESSDLEGQSLTPGTPAYYQYLTKNGFGKQLRKNLGVDNDQYVDDQAIQLAAVLYKHYYRAAKKTTDVPNVVVASAGDGSVKTQVALQILSKMNGIYGETAAKNIKFVSFGNPSFSLFTNPAFSETKMIGSSDLFRFATALNNNKFRAVNSTHAATNYLSNGQVVDLLKSLLPTGRPKRSNLPPTST